MRAIIVTTGRAGGARPLTDRYPTAMLWLADRPFVQHVIESLARLGVTSVEWAHGPKAEQVRRFLGDGRRWGMSFRHHVAATEARLYDTVRTVTRFADDGERFLLGHADRLVDVPVDAPHDAVPLVLYGTRPGAGHEGATAGWEWTGWAALAGRVGKHLPEAATDEEALRDYLGAYSLGGPAWCEVAPGLDARTVRAYLVANRVVLSADPGVRMPGSARVHPTARLVAPVCLGRDVEIGAGAVLGPNAVVGDGCVIDRNAIVANAVVLPGTYVGEELHLDGVVADRDRIVSPGTGDEALVSTGVAVGSLVDHLPGRVSATAAALAGGFVRAAMRVFGVRAGSRPAQAAESEEVRQTVGPLALEGNAG